MYRWYSVLILFVGFGATALFYWMAVADLQPHISTGSGGLFVPSISAEESRITTETGSGSLYQTITDEVSYLEAAFWHMDKALVLEEYMQEIIVDGDLKTVSASILRRNRSDLLQLRLWASQWYGRELPLPGTSSLPLDLGGKPLPEAYSAYLQYEIQHHTWTSAMTRLAQRHELQEELKIFSRYQLRALRFEEDMLRSLAKRPW